MNTFSLLVPLLLIILAGFVAGRLKLFNTTARKALAKFVFYIATGALIITSLMEIEPSDFNKFPKFITANVVVVIGCFLVLYIILRLLKVRYKKGASILYSSNAANSVYLGFPVVKALYGPEGLLYAVAYVAVTSAIADVVYFYVLSHWRKGSASIGVVFKDFVKNPIIVATVTGLALLAIDATLPTEVTASLNYLGASATGLALFAMGLFLAHSGWQNFTFKASGVSAAFKLLAVPAVAYVVARYGFGLTDLPLQVSVMLAAMPSAIFSIIVASQFDYDERTTADSIMLSTVLFLATSVLWASLLK